MKTLGLLGVAFVVLKLCGILGWSWWFVLMPFYIFILIAFIVGIIVLLGWLIWKACKKGKK